MRKKILLIFVLISVLYFVVIKLNYKYNLETSNKDMQIEIINTFVPIEIGTNIEIIDTLKTGYLINYLFMYNSDEMTKLGVVVLKKHLLFNTYKFEYIVHEADGIVKYVGIDYFKNYLMKSKGTRLYKTHSYDNNIWKKYLFRFLFTLVFIEVLYKIKKQKNNYR
ncbi:MAG: hypothetical protein N4A50_11575 [Vallitalea sp.]|nr:hypothetical protein [Vallitalea sp.]